jgi:hypothetical protein
MNVLKNGKHMSSARSTKNANKQKASLERHNNSDYKFGKHRGSTKNTLFKKSGKTLKQIYAINQNVKNCMDSYR